MSSVQAGIATAARTARRRLRMLRNMYKLRARAKALS
jgi:hypothetical protein